MINWNDFQKVEIRVGTILEVRDFPEAIKPAYKLKIDFGKFGTMKSSAQITDLYSKEELKGKQIIAVTNFPPKQIANFISECLVLGFETEKGVVLVHPGQEIENGLRIS